MNEIAIKAENIVLEKEENLILNWYKEDECYSDEKGRIMIKINTECVSGIRIIQLDCSREYDHQQIEQAFIQAYREHISQKMDDLESGLEMEENIITEPEIRVPYNPKSIQVVPARYSLKEIVDMINGYEDEEPTLELSPEFQRGLVWDNVRKSRLIESILLRIPLPVFYLARDREGKLQVVDGMQRLSTINSFFRNKFCLTHLEYLEEECGNLYFKHPKKKSLHPKFVRLLRSYQIDCNIIEPDTPENVKLDIFKRLNTGGKSLNKQEVRHAFMKRPVREFVDGMTKMKSFQKATDNSIKPQRMMDQELVLRFVGFYLQYYKKEKSFKYMGNMAEFIDEVVVWLNQCDGNIYQELQSEFQNAMKKAYIMFGKLAFRKLELTGTEKRPNEKYRNPINRSLFVTFSVLLCRYPLAKIKEKEDVSIKFAKYLKQKKYLSDGITQNTNNYLMEITFPEIENFLKELYLNDR